MSKIHCLMLTMLVAGAASGCREINVPEGPGPGVRVREPHTPQAGVQYDSVVVLDKSLQNWNGRVYDPPGIKYLWPDEKHKYARLAIESTSAERTPTDTVKVIAVLRNRTDHDFQVEGRTHFFNGEKQPVEEPTPWQRVFLPAQGVAHYQEFSKKRNEVAHYYVEIREAR